MTLSNDAGGGGNGILNLNGLLNIEGLLKIKSINTSNRKANFATILLDCKNSLVPSKYFCDENIFKLVPSDTRPKGLLISIYYTREI